MIITILGNRGTGKSTLAEYLAHELNPKHVVIWDPANQFLNADHTFYDTDELEGFFEDDGAWEEKADPFIARYVPGHGPKNPQFDAFARVVWAYSGAAPGQASYSLIVDEANSLMSLGPNGINDWLDDFLRRSMSREKGNPNPVDIILCAHRPQDVNAWVWENSKYIYTFYQTGNGAALMGKYFGTEVEHQVQQLKGPQNSEDGGSGVSPVSETEGYDGPREILKITVATGRTEVITDNASWYTRIEVPQDEDAE